MKNSKQNFIETELGQFKRKYWLAKLVQGLLIFAGTGLVLLALVSFIEYFSWLSTTQRTVLFIATVSVETALIVLYIGWPLLQLLFNGKGLSDSKAADLIGNKLDGVNDRLTNYLELRSHANSDELIDASLNQKQEYFKSFRFQEAVKLSTLRPFLLFLLPSAILLLFIWSGNRWFMLEQGASRLLHFTTHYQRELPFKILINQDLETQEGGDFELRILTEGNIVPDELIIKTSLGQTKVRRVKANSFVYEFKNCLSDINFVVGYDEVFTDPYKLTIIKKAAVGRVSIKVSPPSYTKLAPFVVENVTQLEVPQNAQLTFTYAFKNALELTVLAVSATDVDSFTLRQNDPLQIKAGINTVLLASHNRQELNKIGINVLIDKRPDLDVKIDSSLIGIEIKVNASDDYGIVKASAVFMDNEDVERTISLPIKEGFLKTSLALNHGQIDDLKQIKIVVFDNYGTTVRVVDLSKYKVQEQSEKDLLNKSGSEISALSKEKKEQKKTAQQIKEEQRKTAQELQKSAKELTKKDSVLYQRFEELSEEIMKLTEQLETKLPENRNKLTEKKLEEKIAELEKEWMILQTIEQLKRMEDSLSLSDKSINKQQMNELQNSAKELEKKLEEEKNEVDWKKFEEIKKDNEELTPEENKKGDNGDKKKQESESKEKELKKEMKEDSKALQDQLSKMSDMMMMETTEKNIALLRRLELRSLKTSKNQELVYEQSLNGNLIDKKSQLSQKEVLQGARAILDSLNSLTVSDADLADALMENQTKLDLNLVEMDKSSSDDVSRYVSNQRYLQYGLNDLAAILYDILKAESKAMMDMKKGNKQCNNPKPGKGKKPSLSEQQGKLGKKMGEGSKPGKGKPGKGSFSQSELLELIKGQEAIIEQYEQRGKNGSGEAKLAEEMNKQLEDLLNNNIDKALLRNKEIEDKLIVLEQSENEKKDQDEKRESTENQIDYDLIKKQIVQDYIKNSQRGSSIVNLPALQNYFTGKWVQLNQE